MKATSVTAAEAIPLTVAETIVQQGRNALDVELATISAGLDWGDPAVAFYGETNAGKSTLIEALRLLFRSPGKTIGRSIGDGRPDFTREGAAYLCEHDGVRFNLLDVPGIEGDEAQVSAEIVRAVRRAHTVFYVTPDARPPQGGDGGREGTLEKIRRQLRPQAKVWAIYNKKVQNPGQFCSELLTEDEAHSLADGPHSLDAKMHDALGENYRGHIAVTALPGFLALAAEMPLGEPLNRKRTKFLREISKDKLLTISNLPAAGRLLIEGMPTAEEVVGHNLRKLVEPVAEAADLLEQRAAVEFAGPAAALTGQLTRLRPTLEEIVDDGSKGISRLVDELANGYVRRARETMLKAIDRGLKDDAAMKRELDTVIGAEKDLLPEVVKTRVSDTVERTRKSSDEALSLFRQHLQNVRAFDSPTFSASFSHATEVNTRSGIEWAGVVMSVIGLAIGGPIAGPIAAITAAIGIASSVWRWFSSSHRQREQKQSLNRNLDALKPHLHADVAAQLKQIDTDLRAYVLGLMEPLRSVEHGLQEADRYVRDAAAGLRHLAANNDELRSHAERRAHKPASTNNRTAREAQA